MKHAMRFCRFLPLLLLALFCFASYALAADALQKAGSAISGVATNVGEAVGGAAEKVGDAVSGGAKKTGVYLDDSSITAAVKAAYVREKDIHSTDISVETVKGNVTLSGTVQTQQKKEKVMHLAMGVEGVKSVVSDLIVTGDTSQTVSEYADDATTTAAVKKAFLLAKDIHSTDISVKTNRGLVHLTGSVQTAQDRGKVVQLAQSVDGVKGVMADLQVSGQTSQTVSEYAGDAAVTAKIKAAFVKDSSVSAFDIGVDTLNGEVRLIGSVDNIEQKKRAEDIARSVSGVKRVTSDLQINK